MSQALSPLLEQGHLLHLSKPHVCKSIPSAQHESAGFAVLEHPSCGTLYRQPHVIGSLETPVFCGAFQTCTCVSKRSAVHGPGTVRGRQGHSAFKDG